MPSTPHNLFTRSVYLPQLRHPRLVDVLSIIIATLFLSLFWPQLPTVDALLWYTLLIACTLLRTFHLNALLQEPDDGRQQPVLPLRLSHIAVGLLWGCSAFLLPRDNLLLLTLLSCVLLMVATMFTLFLHREWFLSLPVTIATFSPLLFVAVDASGASELRVVFSLSCLCLLPPLLSFFLVDTRAATVPEESALLEPLQEPLVPLTQDDDDSHVEPPPQPVAPPVEPQPTVGYDANTTEQAVGLLLQSNSDSIALVATDGQLLRFNQNFAKTFAHGYPLHEGALFLDLFTDQFRQELQTTFTTATSHGQKITFAGAHRNLFFHTSVCPLINEQDSVESVVLLFHEVPVDRPPEDKHSPWDTILAITDQSTAGKSWRSRFTDKLLDFCHFLGGDNIFIVAKHGDFIEASTTDHKNSLPNNYDWIFSTESLFNKLKEGEMINTPSHTCPHREQEVLANNAISAILLIPIFTGARLWGIVGVTSLSKITPFDQHRTNTLQFLANCLAMDIRNESYRSERDRLAVTVEQSGDCIIVTDTRGVIQYANPATKEITGYSPYEIMGRSIKRVFPLASRRKLWKLVKSSLLAGEKWQGQFTNERKDKRLYKETLVTFPIHGKNGKIVSQTFIRRDVTEEKRLESIAEASNLMKNIGFIFSGIRHEMGNPLNSIKVSLSILDDNLQSYSQDDIARIIKRSLSDIGRIEYLLKALKNFSIFERPEIENINLTGLLRNFIKLIEPDITKNAIHLSHAIPDEEIITPLDHRAFQQVLLNLVTNAIDALRNQPEKQLHLTLHRGEDGNLTVVLEDSGCGISEAEQANLFTPFYTTKEHGTGLGLIIVKKMLSKMNCTIDITSRQDVGTRASIIIPMTTKDFHLSLE